jgi:hypothetical protein
LSEPTLNAAFNTLQGDVGLFLGYGRGENNGEEKWDVYQQRDIDQCVKGGMRKFYYCGYQWSFLKPTSTVTLTSGEQYVDLPDDYGSSDGRIAVSTTSTGWSPMAFGGPGPIHQAYTRSATQTGSPMFVCEEPVKGTTQDAGQRYRLRIYPIADQDYTFRFTYSLNPNYLSGTKPYAYGGPQHAETLLAACKATAEIDLDDVSEGPQFKEFMRLMEVSMRIDARNKPALLGYNGDRSDSREWWGPHRRHLNTVTFAGVEYD